MSLSIEYIVECLTYDPETGVCHWKERPRHHFPTIACWVKTNCRQAGKIAGSQHYCRGRRHAIRISITKSGRPHEINAARVAFMLMGVIIPSGMIPDHKDGNPFNNKWSNLRLATISQNAQNKVSNRARKHALPKGVYTDGKTFRSSICVNGVRIPLGTFHSSADAHAAYCAKAKELFGEFARFN